MGSGHSKKKSKDVETAPQTIDKEAQTQEDDFPNSVCPEKYKSLLKFVSNRCNCKYCYGHSGGKENEEDDEDADDDKQIAKREPKKAKRTRPRAEIYRMKGSTVKWRIFLENDMEDNHVVVNHEGFDGSDIDVATIGKMSESDYATIQSGRNSRRST
ncbi:uncharacterized protein LOC109606164 isoform X2 [Aethina tumida]|uniref:uncharacterized protein LOC109606164 isoform X2 n=1 Tax=Aethina tumida TaxID=116153 RepID=UPI00096B0026|nr:uncharacterized protein LOC109606164 isoform X2 [Aethina tumida]